jgi:hypothetical protein
VEIHSTNRNNIPQMNTECDGNTQQEQPQPPTSITHSLTTKTRNHQPKNILHRLYSFINRKLQYHKFRRLSKKNTIYHQNRTP